MNAQQPLVDQILDLNAQTVKSINDSIKRTERLLYHMIDEVKMHQNNTEMRVDQIFEQLRQLEPQISKVGREAHNKFKYLEGKL